MLNNKKAILFDMDGTLIDSMWVWTSIDIDFLGKRNFELPRDLQKEIAGMSFSQTAAYFKERFSLEESLEEIMQMWNDMAYDKYATEVKLKSGAFTFLQKLKAQGIKTAICTSNSRLLTDAVLESQGIADYIDVVLTAKEVPNGKPAPDIYLTASKSLGVEPEDCLVFEDVYMGVLAGKNAGMKVCAVWDEHCLDDVSAIRNRADYYISDYQQVLENTYEVLEHE